MNWQTTLKGTVIYHNSVQLWLIALVAFCGAYFLLRLFKRVTYGKLKAFTDKTPNKWDDLIPALIERTLTVFLLTLAAAAAALILDLPAGLTMVLKKGFWIVLCIQAGSWGTYALLHWRNLYSAQKIGTNAGAVTTLNTITFILQIFVWITVFLVALSNLGVKITALVTGLGIGGIAVALAVQNVLSDLLASVSIVLDKPFVIGDFIIVAEHLGTVEHIGLKTTRIRSLSGEQLIFSNTDLLKSRIRNFKRMNERRVVFSLSTVYQTPYEKIEKIPQMIRRIIEEQDGTRFDRAHFFQFGPSALVFEVVYWVLSADYNIYMDIQQAINLALVRQFEEEGIEFAYPTQTVYLGNPEQTTPASAGLPG